MRGSAAFRVAVAPGGALAGPWVRNALWTAARAVPSLDLRFAQNKSLIDDYSGTNLVTFTRASTGTFVGSDGLLQSATTNEARFDHNPTTGESLGLLVEEARTNLITTSEALANVTGASITNNTTTAPDGLVTADTLTEDTSTGGHSVNSASISWAGNTAYTFTFFLKANTRTQANIAFGTSSNWVNGQRNAVFDLSAGTVIATSGSSVTASIDPFLNGWYRCRLTATTVAVPVSSAVQTQMYVSGAASYTGNGTSGLFFWGAQLEAGAFATSYIPTTTATATRAADVASITGTAFSSFYNQTEGTVFGQFLRTASTNSQQGRVFSFNNGTNTNALEIYQTGASNPSAQITATTSQALWSPSGFTVGTSIKEVLGYQLNNSNASFNGSAQTLDTACNIPTVTQARIGDRQDGVRNLNGTIQRLTYWPIRLADPTLQAITLP